MKTFLFYLVFELISLLFLGMNKKTNKNKFLFVFSAIPLICIVGLRDITVGIDTQGYINAFYRLIDGTMSSVDVAWLSGGYRFIAFMVGYIFGKSYVMLNLTVAILTIIFLYKAIIENSKDKTLSLYIFFSICLFYQMLNQSRQMLAISMVLYSYKFIKNRQLKKFIVMIMLSSLIHSSSIIFLPFYFLLKMELNKKSIFKYGVIIGGIIFGWGYLFQLMALTSYGQTYIVTNYYQASNTSIINFVFRLFLLIFVLLFKKSANMDEDNKYLYNLGIWCTIMSFITIKMYIFGRLSTYFYAFYIFIIPNILSTLKKNKRFFKGFIYLLFFALHVVYFFMMSKSGGYGDYSFFFNNM